MATGDKTIIASKDYVNTALANKADAATTLSGYGTTDAYTKTEADARIIELSLSESEINNKATAMAIALS